MFSAAAAGDAGACVGRAVLLLVPAAYLVLLTAARPGPAGALLAAIVLGAGAALDLLSCGAGGRGRSC